MECESRPGLGCLILGTPQCAQARKLSVRAKKWLRFRLAVEMWLVLLTAFLALVIALLWWQYAQ